MIEVQIADKGGLDVNRGAVENRCDGESRGIGGDVALAPSHFGLDDAKLDHIPSHRNAVAPFSRAVVDPPIMSRIRVSRVEFGPQN